MAYCRFSDSDAYLFSDDGRFECCACKLQETVDTIFPGVKIPKSITFKTPKEAADHLREHVAAGHDIPQEAIDELDEEATEDFRQTTNSHDDDCDCEECDELCNPDELYHAEDQST